MRHPVSGPSADAKRLLGGWATDSLTAEERRELLRAALDDQSLFDALVEEDGLRELLAEPAAREQVLAALQRPGRWARVKAWLARPATVADLLAATAVVVLALAASVVYRSTPREFSAASQPSARAVRVAVLERLAALPARNPVPAWLDAEGQPPRLRPGQAIALRLTAAGPARVLVIDVRPDGSMAQAWPAPGEPPALVAADAASPVRSLPFAAPAQPGPHRLRLVLAPVDVDLGRWSPADVHRLAARLTLVDLPCAVERP